LGVDKPPSQRGAEQQVVDPIVWIFRKASAHPWPVSLKATSGSLSADAAAAPAAGRSRCKWRSSQVPNLNLRRSHLGSLTRTVSKSSNVLSARLGGAWGLLKDDGLSTVISDNVLDRQFTAEAPNFAESTQRIDAIMV
jgi:hypothetical protein